MLTTEQKKQRAEEALERATSSASPTNDEITRKYFHAQGQTDVRPRENVLTFWGWQALGRRVIKGQHGLKLTTWICERDKDTGILTGKRWPRTAVVFHVSQTEEI